MSLPSEWVDRIFEKMILVYGHDFMRRWDELSIQAVKADWAHELSRFQQMPDAIKFGLQNLPPAPPNAVEFRAICARRPGEVARLLPDPKADPEVVKANVDRIREALAAKPVAQSADGLDWARKIIERHQRGETVKSYPLNQAKEAILRAEVRKQEPMPDEPE